MFKRDIKPFVMKDAWQIPFLRRKKNEHFEEYFSGNGYYPNDGKFSTNIRLNLQVFCDANEHVSDVTYYKVHDLTIGHGKPVLRDVPLTSKDISVFTKALSTCTISTASEEFETLLNKALESRLPNGWKITSADKKNIEFSDKDGNTKIISRSHIHNAIDISHNYLEILAYNEFWEANAEHLSLEDAEPLLALFSLIDPSTYYEYELLKRQSANRIQQSEITARLELIQEAAKEGNTQEINKQFKCLPEGSYTGSDLTGALCEAIKSNNESLARLLVKKGADINGNYTYNDKKYGPLYFTIDSGWESFLSYCLKQGFKPKDSGNLSLVSYAIDSKKPEMAFILLKAGASFVPLIRSTRIDPEIIPQLLKIPTVDWGVMNEEWVLQSVDPDSFKTIAMKLRDEEGYTRTGFFPVVIEINDPELTQYYMKHCDPILCFRYHYSQKTKGGFEKTWTPYYKRALTKGEKKTHEFLNEGINVCVLNKDIQALTWLIEKLHAIPSEEQLGKMIPLISSDYENAVPLVHVLLRNCQFKDDGEWHGVTSYSEEDRHNYKVNKSNMRWLLGIVLSRCDEETLDIVKEKQANLLNEPWTFRSLYDAVKRNENNRGSGSEIKYDLIGKIASGALLTRKSAAAILKGIKEEKFGLFQLNPEEFISKVVRYINEQKATMIVEHITYDTIEGEYDSSIFTSEKNGRTVDQAFRAQKAIQDYVYTDGVTEKSVERKFAEAMDAAQEVYIYAKLPRGFAIPTPVGNYSPDWAIVFHEGTVKHIYFVAETKGTMESLNLRPIEKAKIDCAKKLFNKLSNGIVTYDHVDSFQQLMNKVM